MATPRLLIISVWILSTLTSFLMGHSYMTSPITRQNQADTNTGCCPGNLASSTNKSPNQNLCTATCDGPKQGNPPPKDSVKVYKRGEQIRVEWPRNNHTGGFVRLSLASYEKTDNQQSFNENIFHLSCYESHCRADLLSDPEGLDSNPANGSKNPCFTYAHIPSWLQDGAYSLQWVWYGGGQALGEYYSCSDLYIEGGPTEPKSKPIFTGGDPFTTESGQCRYFNNANNLGVCVADNCPNRAPPQIGIPAGEFKTWSNVIESGEGATNLPMADRKCNEKQLPEPDRLIRDGTGRPVCGKNNPNSTCPFGMCCSAAGFCGPFKGM
ncbi:hypothetical protein BKA69DRAFT_1097684 [Paraphysoderma sedebokerense]|nr:hypothetical protein BKA69DRAFT_1097684 [Paraphysoderma sedebokerense]